MMRIVLVYRCQTAGLQSKEDEKYFVDWVLMDVKEQTDANYFSVCESCVVLICSINHYSISKDDVDDLIAFCIQDGYYWGVRAVCSASSKCVIIHADSISPGM